MKVNQINHILSIAIISVIAMLLFSTTLSAQEDLTRYSKAYFASGCFWCVEEVFESVKGVHEVVSGYSGGKKETARYDLVSAQQTNHAESVEVYYDPTVIPYPTLLKVFFGSHDPTTLNQQGPDRGRAYRSMVFYQNGHEKKMVEDYITKLRHDKVWENEIVTEVVPFEAFYVAEDYHQNYVRLNPTQAYVLRVSIPRFEAFKKKYPELLK